MAGDKQWSGLQIERTTLAWLRTTLSFVIGALVISRLIARSSLVLALVCAAVVLVPAPLILWLSWRRYRLGRSGMHGGSPLPDGSLPAVLTALAIVVGGIGLVYIIEL